MIQKKDLLVRKIANSILLNSSSIETSGLYNGKSGVSIALFEASKYLQDDNLEDVAFSMIKEAIITENNDISFENGLSGIGYALIHLIEGGFLEADYNELFGNQHKNILRLIELLGKNEIDLSNYVKVVFYIKRYERFFDGGGCSLSAIEKLLKASEDSILNSLSVFNDVFNNGDKNQIIQKVENFLFVVSYSQKYSYARAVAEAYLQLYEQGKIKSSLFLWMQLQEIAEKLHMRDVEKQSKRRVDLMSGMLNSHLLSFRDKVSILHNLNLRTTRKDALFSHYEFCSSKFEYDVRSSVARGHSYIGYEGGAARFLLHMVNPDIELL